MAVVNATVDEGKKGKDSDALSAAGSSSAFRRESSLQSQMLDQLGAYDDIFAVLRNFQQINGRLPDYKLIKSDTIPEIIADLQPRTILLSDPLGLRSSYVVLSSFPSASLTVVCRDGWSQQDKSEGTPGIVVSREADFILRGADTQIKGCFDLVLQFHSGSSNISERVFPLLSSRGVYIEIFIEKADEIVTSYSQSELALMHNRSEAESS